MREVTLFVGGSVGTDPYSKKTWSGSSASLVGALDAAGMLAQAVGIDVPPLRKRLLMLKNVNRNRSLWRQHFFADPAYRQALTEAARGVRATSPVLMQLGHMFSLAEAYPGSKCVSYHDGNLVERLKSGFNIKGISSRRIEQALRYEERAAGEMTAVFTFSEYLRQSFIHDYHVAPARVVNVGGGINLTRVPEMGAKKDYGAQRLLFIGTEFERKGGPLLLEAFARVRAVHPAAELHIAGPRRMEAVPAGVVFHGHLSKDDVGQAAQLEELFRQATVFVLPSLYEPFGIAPLEAMLYGLPCVVTDGWALAESVQDGVTGLLAAKGSAEDFAAKMLRLLAEPETMAQMGERGRARVMGEYTWARVVGRMAEAFTTL